MPLVREYVLFKADDEKLIRVGETYRVGGTSFRIWLVKTDEATIVLATHWWQKLILKFRRLI